jgi:hypothetical protein
MNPKLKAFLLGAGEALAVGFVIGIGSLWVEPKDVVLTWAAVSAALLTGAKFAIVYLVAYLRKNVAFREVWTPERRAVESVK